VPDDFVDRFAVIGPPAVCITRLRALIDLGIERFVIAGPSAATTPDEARDAHRRFVTEVMPALR